MLQPSTMPQTSPILWLFMLISIYALLILTMSVVHSTNPYFKIVGTTHPKDRKVPWKW